MFSETARRSMQEMQVLQAAHRNTGSVQRASPTLQLRTLLPARAGLGTLSPRGRALGVGAGVQAGRPGCQRTGGSLQLGPRTPPAPPPAAGARKDPRVSKQDPTPAISLLQATDYKPTRPLLRHPCCSQTAALPVCSHLSYQGSHGSAADLAPWHPPAGLRQVYAPLPVHFLSSNPAPSFT